MSESKGMTRRDLFSFFGRSLDAARRQYEEEPVAPRLPPPLRPPGAANEDVIGDSCTRCGACIRICPRQAIKPLPALYGDRAGTPFIVPKEAPCVVCTGLLCTTVCPSGTLREVTVLSDMQMGTAVVDLATCLPYHGQACGICHQKCPVEAAITLDEQGRPHIGTTCTGCGLCEYYCPTHPQAIRVRPREAE